MMILDPTIVARIEDAVRLAPADLSEVARLAQQIRDEAYGQGYADAVAAMANDIDAALKTAGENDLETVNEHNIAEMMNGQYVERGEEVQS
jgi:spore germination cell wall hydrolase CwlJ-like protein